ncbi:MAG TPA: hypothetical protein VKZ85_10715 [Woeseiaceae bacterium]|nr:hypothetical protein [Woeseiaceae bacterium]
MSEEAGRPGSREPRALPLVIATTGHRDLVAGEMPRIRERVRDLFAWLAERFPERRLQVVSALAEGADRLVAEEALATGVELVALLPMPRELYVRDFREDASKAGFDSLVRRASAVYELPLAPGIGADDIRSSERARGLQYAQLGVFLSAHCHILLALWDGKPSDRLGGTGQIVRFHHDDVMPGYSAPTAATQQMLVDDESDLVYHVVCSRDRPDGAPRAGLEPLDWWWFTKDRERPLSKELPPQHRLVFRRYGEFSEDAVRFGASIEAAGNSLLGTADLTRLPPGIDDIDRLFRTADWLAVHYQRRVLAGLRTTYLLAFFMALAFLLYADVLPSPMLMIAFLLLFAGATAIQLWSRRKAWHRKYLDYRVLAEGLRVQLYWAAAGVRRESVSKFTHDHFLQTQDPELGWIRNVMRVAGFRCDVEPAGAARGLDFAIREWIGDSATGQLGYFGRKREERLARKRITDRLARLSLLVSVVVVAVLLVAGSTMTDTLREWLLVVMGVTLLLFGVRESYADSTAEEELIKQYDFMLRIFQNARRRLDHAENDAERRQILRALGDSALDEHAQWILTNRDRAPEQGDIWRMGS